MKKIVPYLEKLFLVLLLVGLLLEHFDLPISRLVDISLVGLAAAFFFKAYIPLDFEPDEQKEEHPAMGFSELIGLSIAPKVIMISSTIGTLGVLFSRTNTGDNGYEQMLLIGSTTLLIGSVIMMALKLKGIKNIDKAMPVLYRGIPVMLVAGYILLS